MDATVIAALPLAEDEWVLDITVTDAPRVVARDDCDTNDGCQSTCDSACLS
ncbi:FxLD family lanthipeptide [Streptomyces longispororuber]|uniref:FxLD family lanthipeptide n=1 Tax=Streptomyces longispororuber TaxID=68230 RepID=UPI003404EB10